MPRIRSASLVTPLLCGLLAGCHAGRARSDAPVVERPAARRAAPAPAAAATTRFERRPLPRPMRAIWVARMHYRYAEDVRTIVRNCAALGINTIFWQVRGEGTVCYPSAIEPWSGQFEYRDPGFDPLALAVEEAHANGIHIQAWVNVMPGWRGPNPPPVLNQLYVTHPDWFIRDERERRQPLRDDFYVILNPCLPEVRAYLRDVVREVVTRYAVDGVHLDYIRFAWDTTPDAKSHYPRDRRTLELFRKETGRDPDADPERWDVWRATQVSRVVTAIRAMLSREAPGASLTAAVHHDPTSAYRSYLQNGGYWLARGWVDALVPMLYSREMSAIDAGLDAYERLAPGGRIVPGLGIYKLDAATMRRQLAHCLARGGEFALFSYTSLHASHDDRTGGSTAKDRAARPGRRAALRAALAGAE